jgi:hypothetical protein
MGDFFHGWRRKAGVVSLVMALALMVAWGRSYFDEDHIWIAFSRHRALALHTAVDHIAISGEWQEENGRPSTTIGGVTMLEVRFNPTKCFSWVVHPVDEQSNVGSWSVTDWYWGWDHFGYGQSDYGGLGFRLLVIPYWPPVLTLTLLSACLILWKLRKQVKRDA